MDYILKHKNRPVILFSMDEEYKIDKIIETKDKYLLPMGYKYVNNELYIGNNLQKWIDERGLPESRSDREDLYKYGNAKNSKELMIGSYGLNLSDQYWIHRLDKELKWEDINFFDNKFKDIMKDINGKGNNYNEKVNPNLSVNGTLPKYWFIDENNNRVLAKKGRNIQWQEPYNEATASDVMEMLGIKNVHYDLKKNENKEYVSLCKCMIDRNEDLVPAVVILNMDESKGRNNYDMFVDVCNNNGIRNPRESLDKMIFIDYVLGNDDRHLYNFGIIRDADNLKWKDIAPIFDNGNILYYNYQNINNEIIKENIHCRWFERTNDEKLKYMEYPQWYDKKNVIGIYDIINKYLTENNRVSNEKRDVVIDIIRDRIKFFENQIKEKIEKNIQGVDIDI